MAPTQYGGYLYSKRKSELEEIATALNIELPDQPYVKSDLEDLIRDTLRSNTKARSDPRFSDLWERMPESRRYGDDEDATAVKRTPRSIAKSANAAVTEAATPVLNSVSKSASNLTKSAQNSIAKTASNVSNQLAVATPRRLTKAPSFASTTKKAKETVVNVVAESQDIMVADWAPTTLALALEFAYLFYGTVPYENKTVGPHQWLTRSSTPSFTIQVPKYEAVLSQNFLVSSALFAAWTIVLPLVLSLFIAPAPLRNVGRRGSAPRVSPPGPIPFHLFRLAVVFVRGYVFASHGAVHVLKDMALGHHQAWSFESVKGYPTIQLISSALALGITMYHEFY